MSAALRENEFAIRTCILYEALDHKPIEESYKNFCGKVGKDAMTFYDFDYWFYRFHNGNHDLHHDRSKDPKQLTLSDMPIDLMPEILSNVDPIDRLVLRKVSKGLRQVVKNMRWEFDTLTFIKKHNCFDIHYPSSQTMYHSKENGCSVTHCTRSGDGKQLQIRKKFVEGGNQRELFHNDCKIFLENKNVHLKSFDFFMFQNDGTTCEKYFDSGIEVIKSSKKFITTSLSISVWSFHEISQILTLIQPESLEGLDFQIKNGSIGYEHVVNTVQWKMAKNLKLGKETSIPIEHLLHFTTFTVRLMEFTVEDARKIRDMLDTSETFEKAGITVKTFDSIEIARVFDPDFEFGVDEDENEEFYYTNPKGRKFRIEFSASWNGEVVTIEYLESDDSDDSEDLDV